MREKIYNLMKKIDLLSFNYNKVQNYKDLASHSLLSLNKLENNYFTKCDIRYFLTFLENHKKEFSYVSISQKIFDMFVEKVKKMPDVKIRKHPILSPSDLLEHWNCNPDGYCVPRIDVSKILRRGNDESFYYNNYLPLLSPFYYEIFNKIFDELYIEYSKKQVDIYKEFETTNSELLNIFDINDEKLLIKERLIDSETYKTYVNSIGFFENDLDCLFIDNVFMHKIFNSVNEDILNKLNKIDRMERRDHRKINHIPSYL
jgi:hypothetical protein